MYPWTTYIWSLCNIFMHPPASITPFVELSVDQSVVEWPGQFIVSSKHFNCTTSTPFFHRDDVFYLLYTRASMVSLLRNTQRRLWHLGWYICLSVSVYVAQWIGSLLLVSQKNCTPHSLDSGLSHPGRIRIDAHRSKACRRGRPRSLIWSVCTHRSRLPTVVASERFVSVWATGQNLRLFVLREYPLVSAKPGECVRLAA